MPTPTTQELLQQAENFLDEIADQIATIEPDRNQASAMLEAVTPVRNDLADFLAILQQLINRLIEYQNAFYEPALATPTQKRATLALYGICLEAVPEISLGNGWDNDERVNQAYLAVYNIIKALEHTMYADSDTLGAILQFIQTFGGTRLRIIAGGPCSGAAAITGMLDEQINGTTVSVPVIQLYAAVKDGSEACLPIVGFVHSAANIVHEFGHVLLDLTEGAFYQDWEQVRVNFSRGNLRDSIGIDDGWGSPNNRENRFDSDDFGTECADVNSLCLKFEVERVADLFLYWIYQNLPNLPSGFTFDTQNADSFIADVAEAFQNFLSGGTWTREVSGVPQTLSAQGLVHWITESGTLNQNVECLS
jgi:hypothetical protein